MVPLHFDHEEIQPESPTAGADLDLVIQVSSNKTGTTVDAFVKQDGGHIVVIPVDRCILLPTCFMLANLCSTLPADPDHADCNCFRLRVGVADTF